MSEDAEPGIPPDSEEPKSPPPNSDAGGGTRWADEAETLLNIRRESETLPGDPRAPWVPPTRAGQGGPTAAPGSFGSAAVSLPARPTLAGKIEGTASPARYTAGDEIARGGMGAIVRVTDNDIRRAVAKKVILGDPDPDRVARFVEEAQVTGQLEHPNIVPVHELGIDATGRVYFTMKLVKGESLDRVLDRLDDGVPEAGARWTLPALLQVFLKVCDAVAFAHSKGVIHRDLKPENVMAGSFGEVLVLDWGLAKVRGAAEARRGAGVATVRSEDAGSQSLEGDVMGTPAFMPPEQAAGQLDRIDERSDVFSLGAVLYQILTGEPPYAGPTADAVLKQAILCAPIPPRRRAPARKIPHELASVCLKAMARRREDRYPSVEALAADLRAFLEHRLVAAHRYGPAARFLRFVQRHPAASLAAGVALVLLAAGAAAGSFLVSRARQEQVLRIAAQDRAERERAEREGAEAKAEAASLKAEKEEREKAAAQARAQDAEETLDKGRIAFAVLRAAFVELGGVQERLKASLHGAGTLEEARAFAETLWPEVEAFEARVPADGTSRASWLAAKGWLRRLAGHEEEALDLFRRSREADADVAYGALFEAMVWFARYLRNQPFPAYSVRGNAMRFHKNVKEWDALEEIRVRFEEQVAGAGGARIWGESSAADFLSVLEDLLAVLASRDSDYARAERGLTRALHVPEMYWLREELLFARAKMRILCFDFDGALGDVADILRVTPDDVGVRYYEAKAWICKGTVQRLREEDARDSFRTAVARLDALERTGGMLASLRSQRSMARYRLAQEEAGRGGDPLPLLLAAIEDETLALAEHDAAPSPYRRYNLCVGWQQRGTCRSWVADLVAQRGGDPTEVFEAALGDFQRALHAQVWQEIAKRRLMGTLADFARHRSRRGEDPVAFLEARAAAARQRAERADAETAWEAWADLAHWLEALGRPGDAHAAVREAFERSREPLKMADFGNYEGYAEKGFAAWIARLQTEAAEPGWRQSLRRGLRYRDLGGFARALDALESAVDGADRNGSGAPAADVALARAAAAATAARLSTGRATLGEEAAPRSHEEGASFRGRALAHLARAVELGWTDLGAKDLDPIRDAPEFRAAAEKAGR